MITLGSVQLDLWIASMFFPFVRILALFSAAPLLRDRALPIRARIGLALLVTALVAPLAPPPGAIPPGSAAGVLVLIGEILTGIAIGFAVRMAFAAIELAGDLIGLQTGLGFATFFDPRNATATPVIGSFLGILATLLFLSIDGHLMLLDAVVQSFETIPPGTDTLSAMRWEHLAGLGKMIFTTGLQIAMPVVAAMLIANIALGVMARAAPQLNLFSVGFPVTLGVGILTLVLTLGSLREPMERALMDGLRLLQ